MNEQPDLHSSIVAMISLASGIASRHPDMGLCQLKRLRHAGVPEYQIDTVIEVARHIRDEASARLDAKFDDAVTNQLAGEIDSAREASVCCAPTASGQTCC